MVTLKLALLRAMLYVALLVLDRKAEDELTEERAREDRRRLEDWLYMFSKREQKGWFKKARSDDALLKYLQVVLKSRYIEEKLNGKVYPVH